MSKSSSLKSGPQTPLGDFLGFFEFQNPFQIDQKKGKEAIKIEMLETAANTRHRVIRI